MSTTSRLAALAERWANAKAAERSNAQSYLKELCAALGVEEPRPAGTGYEFEFAIKVIARDGTESTNFVDLYKANHFALEAKDEEAGKSTDMLLRKAFGQVRSYVGHLPHERPPYLMVLDVGRTLMIWDRWNGDYGGFNAGRRIDLTTVANRQADIDLLRDIWENPAARDPRSKAVAVTKEIAERLAELAAKLERDGFEQERVARFLMRCVFTMFAEDVGLLGGDPFRHIIDDVALNDPKEFVPLAEELWKAMDEGKRFLLKKLLRFNGHFFKDAEALPLTREALALLLTATAADWTHVEPTIFGTLLTRALDPAERHKLGAEYTPRAYVERVVRPTVEEPIRERWTLVQADVLQLRERGRKKDLAHAEKRLREFHAWLNQLQFLDPACGSGNFLYVTMHAVKRIELEAIRLLEDVTDKHELRITEVGPWQFHGIEVKPWAREIAELTLWIGFHQFWKEHHAVQPPEPVLRDTGTLECRDAVLNWDRIIPRPERGKPDPTPRLKSPVTGELVPDPKATLPYAEYVNAKPAPWPRADFIIGNPPYLGEKRQREVFGDGYVDALRAAYPEVSDSADFVTYWWYRAAEEVAAGRTIRAGLITTNTLVQAKNRVVIENAGAKGARVIWAVADHPWVEGADGAAVRVAMTVIARDMQSAVLLTVDDDARVIREVRVPMLNADLSTHADVPRAAGVPLLAAEGLASQGVKVGGKGFVCTPEEAKEYLAADGRNAGVLRQFRNGRDLSSRPRGVYVVDFALMTEDEARTYPSLYQRIHDLVLPERAANARESYRRLWWRFLEPRRELREALEGLKRYIVTLEVSKHRFFTFLDESVTPDGTLVAIASDDPYVLGVLSSEIHVTWAHAAGGRMGVGNDLRYTKSLCFNAFPFPVPRDEDRTAIRDLANEIEAFRISALASDERVTVTAMYNVVEKLRTGADLSDGERTVHRMAACGLLRELHDRLDAAVAAAYRWPWPISRDEILLRLVDLHDARAAEEVAGQIRWIRPQYQQPRFGGGVVPISAPTLDLPEAKAMNPRGRPRVWPATAIEQMTALQRLLARNPLTVSEALVRFASAKRDILERHLETLRLMGELWLDDAGRYHISEAGAAAA